ncbi:hypothetical protein E1091_17770, partial [Micromonospora fluostatini]
MRTLWFDLRESIGRIENAIAGHQAGRARPPWLVLDLSAAQVWCTPVTGPPPYQAAVVATHVNGPPPADTEWPFCWLPVTRPDADGHRLIDHLRVAAGQGHRWLVADIDATSRWLRTAAVYDTAALPDIAVWAPAWLTAGDLGPYPGQIAHGYAHHGAVVARFTAATLRRIAADTDAHARRFPTRDADLLLLHDDGTHLEAVLVRAAAGPAGGITRLAPGTDVAHVRADSDGWYRLTDRRWPWRHTAPTPVAAHTVH